MSVVHSVIILILSAQLLFSDEHSVNSDANTDFAIFKTFAFRQVQCDSTLPDLNNSLYMKNLTEVLRTTLSAKGLKEATANADLLVDFRIDGMELSAAGKPGRTPSEAVQGTRYAQGTLTVDLFAREKNALVWEGIYRDREDTASGLARGFPADARMLLAQYPPKKK